MGCPISHLFRGISKSELHLIGVCEEEFLELLLLAYLSKLGLPLRHTRLLRYYLFYYSIFI